MGDMAEGRGLQIEALDTKVLRWEGFYGVGLHIQREEMAPVCLSACQGLSEGRKEDCRGNRYFVCVL